MNEIDDIYKQESEDIDTNFLESIKNKHPKKNSWDSYLEQVRKSRGKFNKKYGKYVKREKWRIRHQKKKRQKKKKYKHLEVKHFNFKFNFFQRTWFSLNVFFFRVKRFLLRVFVKITPKLLIYAFFKIIKTIRFYYKSFKYWLEIKKNRLKDKLKKFFNSLVEKIKSFLLKSVKILKNTLSKITFWKKKKDDVNEDNSGEESKEADGKESKDIEKEKDSD